uniref:Metallophos domain-containing protein n=1 Tax=Panagrellus redivivus TaxID=6233 RepID=A0A7E4ZX27_PANRE
MASSKVFIDEGSRDAHTLWVEKLSNERVHQKLSPPLSPSAAITPNSIRFVCISDTHDKLDQILDKIPPGDVLIHTGDFTCDGDAEHIKKFNEEIGTLPHKYKIVIAGNHELGFQDDEDESLRNEWDFGKGTKKGYDLLTNCTYLQDSGITLYGIKIYGASWHPLPGFPFSRPRGASMVEKWDLIPDDTDILLTHTPPLGHSDLFKGVEHWGCADLLDTVEQRVKPAYHIFGHVHENNGWTTNGTTTFINASICNYSNEIENKPAVFDFPLPQGVLKD